MVLEGGRERERVESEMNEWILREEGEILDLEGGRERKSRLII